MTTPAPTPLPATPSVDQVVAALNRTALPQRTRVRLSTAAMLTLVLGAALVMLLAAFAAFSWVLVRETERLISDIRHHRATTASETTEAVNPNDVLDDATFAKLMQERPTRTAELYRQRAMARWRNPTLAAHAREDFAQAAQLDPQSLQASDRLCWADLELRHDNPERARTLLRDCDLTGLTTAQQQHLTRLLLTLHDRSRQ